jgi:hypothetical protein
MAVWITCDAPGCDARCEAEAYEGYERGEVDVKPPHGWQWRFGTCINSLRRDLCPAHERERELWGP